MSVAARPEGLPRCSHARESTPASLAHAFVHAEWGTLCDVVKLTGICPTAQSIRLRDRQGNAISDHAVLLQGSVRHAVGAQGVAAVSIAHSVLATHGGLSSQVRIDAGGVRLCESLTSTPFSGLRRRARCTTMSLSSSTTWATASPWWPSWWPLSSSCGSGEKAPSTFSL